MNRIAFIDHSFHKKTKSSNFFLDLLKEKYKVDVYYDTYWIDKIVFDFEILSNKEYNAVIFWQINYNIKNLRKIKCQNIIYIPMYDDFVLNTIIPFYWKQFSSVKFISYSKTLHDYLLAKGLDSLYIKYFPEMKETRIMDLEDLTAFFWYRVEAINWEMIKKFITPSSFKKIYIQNHPDPAQKQLEISKEDIEKYNIEFIGWFKNKEDYLNIIKHIDVYFAPRVYEGIGLSFLEVMSYGKFIVAFNKPTMNEYILQGKNGFLYDSRMSNKIDFSKINQKEIWQINKQYRQEYLNSINEIFNLIEKPINNTNEKLDYIYMIIDILLRFPFRVFRKLLK